MKTVIILSVFLSFFTNAYVLAEDLKQEVLGRVSYLKEINDHSRFFISVASEDQPILNRHTKVHFIVTDSSGRKTGFESFFVTKRGNLLVNEYKEIPNSSYGVNQVGSLDPGVVPDEPESATLDLFPPVLKDTYTIKFIGLDNCRYHANLYLDDTNGEAGRTEQFDAYITSGTAQQYTVYLDPTPGVSAPVISKVITFDIINGDVSVARQLSKLGDDKFAVSLVRHIDLAEEFVGICDKKKIHKSKSCEPASAVLRLFVKRLELANRKCDTAGGCDEGPELAAFEKAHRGDRDYDEFFRAWDKDDWHKWKKTSKRFVTDEALGIIRGDAEILIKTLEPFPKEPGKH